MVSLSLKLLMPRARKPKFVKEPDALSIQNPLKNPERNPLTGTPFWNRKYGIRKRTGTQQKNPLGD